MKRAGCEVLACAVWTCCWVVMAPGVVLADSDAARSAIEKRIESYVAAFNAKDAAALAGHWSENAVYTNPISGAQVTGRAAIAREFEAILGELADAKLKVDVKSIEFVSPSVAIEQGTAVVMYPGGREDRSTYSAVHILVDGQWYLDRVTEKEVPQYHSNYEHLKQLEWMVGTWVSADDGQSEQKCWWTRNRNFLVRSFTVKSGDDVDFTGLQLIGWDPSSKRIRSWAFDSDGGFASGRWLHKGKQWYVTTLATLPDGRKGSSVNILRVIDQDHFGWQVTDRIVDRKLLPNIDEIIMKRVSASGGSK